MLGKNNQTNEAQERVMKMQQHLRQMSVHAFKLHELMDPGTTITLTFPEVEVIKVPGKPPKLNRLIITRPYLHVDVSLKPEQEKI